MGDDGDGDDDEDDDGDDDEDDEDEMDQDVAADDVSAGPPVANTTAQPAAATAASSIPPRNPDYFRQFEGRNCLVRILI